MKFRSFFLCLFLIFTGLWYMGSGCANIGSPTGGPKDTLPPNLVAWFPKPNSLNFKGRTLRMEFDEYVKLKDFQSQLIITPRIDNPYQTKVNKNVVELTFDKPLADSTTYTFNFRNGVVDITEGNAAKDLYLAFSTGSYLDSLTIRGNVSTALGNKAAEGATVALYNAKDTFEVMQDKPVYFTKTDKTGNYELRNLKKGNYLLYAFIDKNNNLTLQTKNETYGYWPDTLQLRQSVDSVNLPVFSANADKPALLGARPAAGYYEITFNKPMASYQLEVGAREGVYSNFIEDRKRIRVYPFALQDSLKAVITAKDSLLQEIQETVYLKFSESKLKKAGFALNILPKNGAQQTKKAQVTLNFSKPVKEVNFDSLRFSYDSLNWEAITADDISWNIHRSRAVINKTLNPPKQQTSVPTANAGAEALARGGVSQLRQEVTLVIPKGAFISVEEDTVGKQSVSYPLGTESKTGMISGNIKTGAENYIVQLVKAGSMEVVAEQVNANQYTFKLIEPGDYQIRVIVDSNKNQRWDPGNIHLLQAPEAVFVSPQPITIKANWEIQNPEISL